MGLFVVVAFPESFIAFQLVWKNQENQIQLLGTSAQIGWEHRAAIAEFPLVENNDLILFLSNFFTADGPLKCENCPVPSSLLQKKQR